MNLRTRRIMLILGILLLGPCLLFGFRQWSWQHAMSPYLRYARERFSEKQVIAAEGKPNDVLRTDAELREWYNIFRPYPPHDASVEFKVFVYYVDPWHDGDGNVLYVFFDEHGIVNQVSLGSH